MNRYFSYLNSAKEILNLYRGEESFSSFLKKYFGQHRKFGSKDRKLVSHLCYCYFRLGKSELNLPMDERILASLFFCSTDADEILGVLKPAWNDKISLSLEEKCAMLNIQCAGSNRGVDGSMLNIFPWKDELSSGIEFEKFNASYLIQPDLFLRIRPGKENIVKQKLQKENIDFIQPAENCITLPNAVKVNDIIELNKEAVVQDLSSQKTGDLLLLMGKEKQDNSFRVWDCCTASGGKSIMATDILGNINLTVSDIRESILHNLEKRFAEAAIRNYKRFVIDLSTTNPVINEQPFDLVIADVPCSGSGTWGRTPEQLYYFKETEIDRYSSLQKRIVSNTIPFIKPGGFLLYITCSVFREENEGNIDHLLENFPLAAISTGVIKGYDKKADTMFAALLQKNL